MRAIAIIGALGIALLATGCTGVPSTAPTVTITSTPSELPLPSRGPDAPIDALDAYSLCAAKLLMIGVNQWETEITPFEDAVLKRLDDYGWYVAFERFDPSPDAPGWSGFPARTWARCALDGTMGEVEWLASGFCEGEQPVDDLTDLASIEPYVPAKPHAPACPTGEPS